MALIFVISSFEVQPAFVQHFPLRDKGVHFVEYTILGWLCAGASSRTWPAAPAWRTASFAVFITFLWGLSDEMHQAMVPGRSPELADALADLVGALAGGMGRLLFSYRSVS
jgi:VanZ family protein